MMTRVFVLVNDTKYIIFFTANQRKRPYYKRKEIHPGHGTDLVFAFNFCGWTNKA